MIASGAICIAYETVQNQDRTLPLLTPMSEVAGRMATQQGAKFLEKPQFWLWNFTRWCSWSEACKRNCVRWWCGGNTIC